MTEQETKRYNAMIDALRQIDKIVFIPTSNTSFRRALDHYANDFERIRKLTAPWHDK